MRHLTYVPKSYHRRRRSEQTLNLFTFLLLFPPLLLRSFVFAFFTISQTVWQQLLYSMYLFFISFGASSSSSFVFSVHSLTHFLAVQERRTAFNFIHSLCWWQQRIQFINKDIIFTRMSYTKACAAAAAFAYASKFQDTHACYTEKLKMFYARMNGTTITT